MILNSNLSFKHTCWQNVQDLYPVQGGPKPRIALFPRLIDLFLVACTIGIRLGERVPNDTTDEIASVNSKTYNDPVNDDVKKSLDYLLKILILTVDLPELSKVDRSEKEKLAFSADFNINGFNPANILCEYANTGVIKIAELITNQDTETIENIINYIKSMELESEILPDIDEFGDI